jgi:hypothetical protein
MTGDKMLSIEKAKCPVMNRASNKENIPYRTPVFANDDVFVKFVNTEPDAILCPDYKDNLCPHTNKQCFYLSGWQKK